MHGRDNSLFDLREHGRSFFALRCATARIVSAPGFGGVCSAMGRPRGKGDCHADFNEAIRLDPKDATGFAGRGYAYTEKKDYDRAIADLEASLSLNPNQPKEFRVTIGAILVRAREALAAKTAQAGIHEHLPSSPFLDSGFGPSGRPGMTPFRQSAPSQPGSGWPHYRRR